MINLNDTARMFLALHTCCIIIHPIMLNYLIKEASVPGIPDTSQPPEDTEPPETEPTEE
jgi:hypothetical protein